MAHPHTFVVTLRRDSRELSWGLRLVGGADLATPLIVTRVTAGTPAGRELVRGDVIAKLDEYDARDLRHEDAQTLFRNAHNTIRLVVQRDADRAPPRSPAPAPFAAPPAYRVASADGSGWGPAALPRTPAPPARGADLRALLSPVSSRGDDSQDESLSSQPYRTTPLVLPGAKVRREPGPTESYLRHHPNPAMRAPPHHDYRDVLMKQKVAEAVLHRVVGEDTAAKMVHKQFNSPIGLYSDANIANSVRQNQGPVPANGHYGRPHVMKSHRSTVLYDPAQSETFRALQEEGLGDAVHEAPAPVTHKLFQPPAKRPAPTPKHTEAKTAAKQTTFVSSLQEESIQQSGSFKRLMFHVLGDAEL